MRLFLLILLLVASVSSAASAASRMEGYLKCEKFAGVGANEFEGQISFDGPREPGTKGSNTFILDAEKVTANWTMIENCMENRGRRQCSDPYEILITFSPRAGGAAFKNGDIAFFTDGHIRARLDNHRAFYQCSWIN